MYSTILPNRGSKYPGQHALVYGSCILQSKRHHVITIHAERLDILVARKVGFSHKRHQWKGLGFPQRRSRSKFQFILFDLPSPPPPPPPPPMLLLFLLPEVVYLLMCLNSPFQLPEVSELGLLSWALPYAVRSGLGCLNGSPNHAHTGHMLYGLLHATYNTLDSKSDEAYQRMEILCDFYV